VKKPDGSIGSVRFSYLKKVTPAPFNAEWGGGGGIHQHDKFVVTDFNLPSATVFTGSSNLAPSGEKGNGDNLIMIQDQRVAVAYAIEALRIFDHLHFRVRMEDASGGGSGIKKADKGVRKTTKPKKTAKQTEKELTLAKPKAISGEANWFERYYKAGTQDQNDRQLFSH
jgi:hypothetical protein